jgi:hypothetical protein
MNYFDMEDNGRPSWWKDPKKVAPQTTQLKGIGSGFTELLDEAKQNGSEFYDGLKGWFKSGSEAPTGAIGDGASLGLKFNGTDAIKKGSDELISFGTDASGKSIGGLTGGTVANAAADAIITGDVEGAATDALASSAGIAAGNAVAGPLGGMIGGALASSLVPKKKKRDLDPDKVHLI